MSEPDMKTSYTFTTKEDFLALLNQKEPTRIKRMWYAIKRTLSNLKFRSRVAFWRAVRGYDEYDVWEYASNNSRRAVKLLTLYKNNLHGCPSVFTVTTHEDGSLSRDKDIKDAVKSWDAVLEDMIFFHKVVAGLERDTPIVHDGISFNYYDYLNLSPEEVVRYNRGKQNYFEHYEGLWD